MARSRGIFIAFLSIVLAGFFADFGFYLRSGRSVLLGVGSIYRSAIERNVTARITLRHSFIRKFCDDNYDQILTTKERLNRSSLYAKNINKQRRFIIDNHAKIAMCLVAKGGSEFWKYLFLHTTGAKDLKLSTEKSSKGLSYLNLESFEKLVNSLDESNYSIFVFGRNPWDRLVSLYRQKVEPADYDSTAYRYVRGACGEDVKTFLKFLQCVIRTYNHSVPDRHWEPVTTRCDLCSLPYTYFGQVEYMNEEASEIFKLSGLKGNFTTFFNEIRNSTIRDVESAVVKRKYSLYYSDIPKEIIESLGEIYKYDIGLFNYPSNPWV